MRVPAAARLAPLVLAFLSVCCVSSEVKLIPPRHPAKSDDCEVAVFPATKPPFPYEDIATDRAGCVLSRDHCINRLRADACEVGADTIYGFSETKESVETSVSATLARRTGPPAPAAPGAAPAAAAGSPPTFSR
jgi:hypothetical protein